MSREHFEQTADGFKHIKPMSETPRTDAAIRCSEGQWSYVLRDCSRQLERELNEANSELVRERNRYESAISMCGEEACKIIAERDTALAQAAQMRAALHSCHDDDCAVFDEVPGACDCGHYARWESALSSDAGKDYVHKSEVEKAYREGHKDAGGFPTSNDFNHSRARRVVEGSEKV